MGDQWEMETGTYTAQKVNHLCAFRGGATLVPNSGNSRPVAPLQAMEPGKGAPKEDSSTGFLGSALSFPKCSWRPAVRLYGARGY